MKFKLKDSSDAGWRATLAAFLFIWVGLTPSISGQGEGLLDIKTVENSLKNQYQLTKQELKVLRPILRQQNQELVIALDRSLYEGQTDYFSLWTKIITKREEFEAVAVKGMTPRQSQVMRAARLTFELRILNEWRSLYVEELASFLELDWFQATMLEKIFQKDQKERLKTISPASRQYVGRSWHELSEDLEREIELILSPDQLTDYRKLKAKGERQIA